MVNEFMRIDVRSSPLLYGRHWSEYSWLAMETVSSQGTGLVSRNSRGSSCFFWFDLPDSLQRWFGPQSSLYPVRIWGRKHNHLRHVILVEGIRIRSRRSLEARLHRSCWVLPSFPSYSNPRSGILPREWKFPMFVVALLSLWIKQYGPNLSINVFAKETEDDKKRNAILRGKKERKEAGNEKQGAEVVEVSHKKESRYVEFLVS